MIDEHQVQQTPAVLPRPPTSPARSWDEVTEGVVGRCAPILDASPTDTYGLRQAWATWRGRP
jgi:hypothetical protein